MWGSLSGRGAGGRASRRGDNAAPCPGAELHPWKTKKNQTTLESFLAGLPPLGGAQPASPPQIILQSMHKYKPRVHIIAQDSRFDLAQIQSLPAEGVQTFSFQETEFTTVTAYQNQQVPGTGRCGGGGAGWRAPAVPRTGGLESPYDTGGRSRPSPLSSGPFRSHPSPDHEAEDRQESLRQRFSGSREEQVRAGAGGGL